MSEKLYQTAKYIRLSYTEDYDKESDSVSNQRKILDSYIESQADMEITCEYVDDGISGVIFDRPAFQAMMGEIKEGHINCVVVKDLSRLGREYIQTGQYLRRIFPAYGVRFIALNDGIDTAKDRSDDLIISVKSIINDSYSRDISIKTRSALEVKRKGGAYVGACPIYGYQKAQDDHNKLIPDPYTSQIVKEIFRKKADGMSAAQIAKQLNDAAVLSPLAYKKEKNLPCPKGGYGDKADTKWSPSTIIRILNDETYTGTLIQGKQGTYNYKIKDIINKPQEDWHRIENAHEPIISHAYFDLVQRILRLDTRTSPGSETVYPFSGILICGCCGARMTRKTVSYKQTSYVYYICPTGKKKGCTNPPMMKEDDCKEIVLTDIKMRILGIVSLESILAAGDTARMTSDLAGKCRIQIAEHGEQLDKLLSFKSRLYENMVTGNISKEDYKELRAKYGTDEEHLRESLTQLEKKLSDILEGKTERMQWIENFRRFENWKEVDRRMVAQLIQSIRILGKTEIQINYHYQDEYEKMLALSQVVNESESL
jgi:DNA invertase Pin-like site-specific DNA recombinase